MLTGEQKLRLIQDLAEGAKTFQQCADEYGYSGPQAINAFKVRNKALVEKVKAGFERRMEDLWVADKHKRIATYQESIESLVDLVDRLEPDRRPVAHKAIHAALRNVAEELGQLAPKEVPVAGQLSVRLEGVRTEDLK